MGKTPTPLTIWIDDRWCDRPEVLALKDKGHNVKMLMLGEMDVILHPAAHWWDDVMWEKPAYLEAALKRARAKKKAAK